MPLAALLATTFALPISATCADTDADTVAITRDTPAGWVVDTSTAGGPWQRAFGPSTRRISACPEIAAASDGTLVLAVGDGEDVSRVRVRRPGATFGPPTTVRHREGPVHLAAAPGGQAAMLWYDWRGTSGDLFARVGRTTTRLARVRSFGPLGLTLAPDGTATAVWNESEPASKQVAEFRAGRWSRPAELSSGRHNGWSDSGIALSQASNGRRLLAWMGARRLRVSVSGEPTRIVAQPRVRHASVELTPSGRHVIEPWSVESIRSALADDGSAAVVYQTPDGLFAVTRGPGRAWSPPNVLHRGALDYRDTARVAVAAGGRTRVTWLLGDGGILAAARDARGRWDAPAVLSPPGEDVASPHLAAGHVVWVADGTLHVR